MDTEITRTIQENARELRRLNALIHATFAARDRGPKSWGAWEKACTEFHQQCDQLAFPGGYSGALDRILAGDSQTVEAALCFVECRPYFHRSGYMFKDLLRKLKRAPMDEANAERLGQILAAYAEYRGRRRRYGE